ncbi:uncharacterized protein [Apostichopus japonicus]|uniref:uncharacterized protein isoform X3 n=1 Tax=Stichopus japonicus TaxID=307972 RepID=UPI003AB690B8
MAFRTDDAWPAFNYLKKTSDGLAVPTTVLNIFTDYDYNRSVITIAAHVDYLAKSVVAASTLAAQQIDMTKHNGIHPRLGAVDLIPIHPLSTAVSLEKCGNIANDIACQLVDKIDGFSCFLFGSADEEKKSLVDRRKEIGWFRGHSSVDYESGTSDLGSKCKRFGITGIGASYYVMNCNVTIKTQDLAVGRRIAKAIRGTSPGGLNGVQAMAFPHRGNIEVACNVESYQTTAEENEKSVSNPRQTTEQIGCESTENTEAIRKEWIYSSPQTIEQRVAELARNEGIELVGTALVGFTPDKAYELAIKNLREGNSERWKIQKVEHM